MVLSLVLEFVPFQAHGDGFTQENVYANIGNRKMAMFIKVNPPILTSENLQDRYLQLRFFDADTNQSINNVSFFLNVTKGDQKFMYDLFYTNNGIMEIKFQPGGTVGQWTVYGDKEPTLGGWYSQTNQVDVQAPILSDSGLYHFNMELEGFDYPNEIVTPYGNKVKFDSYLSVGDIFHQTINYNARAYNTTLVSYFDKIENINFDPSQVQLSWSMPFDWNPARYQDRPFLVHEEVRIPNLFKEFASTPTFSAIVNGNPLTPDKIIQDPYSLPDTTIVHLFINKADMQRIAVRLDPNTSTMDFSLRPTQANVTTSTGIFTDFGGWEIKLGWSPTQLNANDENNLKLTFFDQLTGQQVTDDVNYDLKILDTEGNVILSKSNLVAKGGIDNQSILLPTNGIYGIHLSVDSIVINGTPDTSRNGVARGNLVIPSSAGTEPVPEFPTSTIVFALAIISICFLVEYRKHLFYNKSMNYQNL
jgi:hypothetical protein